MARFNEGLALTSNAKWEEARLKFLQSLSLFKGAPTLYNLATVEQKTGHDLEAIEHYRAFLQVADTDARITDQQRARAKQTIAELLHKVGQIDIRAPAGTTIRVDGKLLQGPPMDPAIVSPGRHSVEGSRNGTVRSVVVEPEAGKIATATLDFPEASAAVSATPPVTSSGSSWSTARIVTVGALAAVAITGGVLWRVFRSNAEDDVNESKSRLQGRSCLGVTGPNCTAARELMDDRDSNVTFSTVSLVGGAAFAGAAIATATFLWPKRGERSSARVIPIGSPGATGIGFVGRF